MQGQAQGRAAGAVCAALGAWPWREQEWAQRPGVHGSEWASVQACVGDCVSRAAGPGLCEGLGAIYSSSGDDRSY